MMICEAPAKAGNNVGRPTTGTDAGYQRHRRARETPCDECRVAHNAKTRAGKARAYASHTTKVKAQNERWRQTNRSTSNAAARRRYQANPERFREECRQWHENNREHNLLRTRRWRDLNREATREQVRRQRVRKRSAPTVPFTSDQLAARMAYWGDRCWMCRGPFEHVDHVKPLAKGGPHMLANLRPACGSCNSAKKARWSGVHNLTKFMKAA